VSSFLRVNLELPEKLGDGRRNLESLHMFSDLGSAQRMVLAGGVVVCAFALDLENSSRPALELHPLTYKLYLPGRVLRFRTI